MSSKTKEELFEEHLSQNKHLGSFNTRDMFSGHPNFEKSLKINVRGPKFQTHESSPQGGPNPYVGDYDDDPSALQVEAKLPTINREGGKQGTSNSAMGSYQNQLDALSYSTDARRRHRESAHFELNTQKDIKDFERRNLSKERRLQEQLKAAREYEDFHKD